MTAFRELPFQFQQRGPELAKATKDDIQKYARFTEQRDQDLENYLANLHGARVSIAIWSVTGIATDGNMALSTSGLEPTINTFGGGTGGFSGSTGSVVWDGDPAAYCMASKNMTFGPDAPCVPGFAEIIGVQKAATIAVGGGEGGAAGGASILESGVSIVGSAVDALNTNTFDSYYYSPLDLNILLADGVTSLGLPDAMLVYNGTVYLYVVD